MTTRQAVSLRRCKRCAPHGYEAACSLATWNKIPGASVSTTDRAAIRRVAVPFCGGGIVLNPRYALVPRARSCAKPNEHGQRSGRNRLPYRRGDAGPDLYPALNRKQSPVDGGDEGGVVGFRLIGIAPRELAQRLIDPIGAPHVPGDHRGATGPSVPLGEKLTHYSGVISKGGRVDSV